MTTSMSLATSHRFLRTSGRQPRDPSRDPGEVQTAMLASHMPGRSTCWPTGDRDAVLPEIEALIY